MARVQGLRVWVSGLGFRVHVSGFRVQGLGFRVKVTVGTPIISSKIGCLEGSGCVWCRCINSVESGPTTFAFVGSKHSYVDAHCARQLSAFCKTSETTLEYPMAYRSDSFKKIDPAIMPVDNKD